MADFSIHPTYLRRRGLELSSGSLFSRGSDPNTINAEDSITLYDEFGHSLVADKPELLQQLQAFLVTGELSKERLVTDSIAGQDLLSVDAGTILILPTEGLYHSRHGYRQYRVEREDGLVEFFDLVRGPKDEGYHWSVTLRVASPNGETVRQKDFYLTAADQSHSMGRLETEWQIGNTPYLRVIDSWIVPPGQDPLSHSLRISDSNQLRTAPTEKTFSYQHPEQRHAFYRSIDQFLARHKIVIGNRFVMIDGKTITLQTAQGTVSIREAEVLDNLLGAASIAPFVHLAPYESIRFYLGSAQELEMLAESNGIGDLCKDVIEERFVEDENADGLHCTDDRAIFLLSHPAKYDAGTKSTHSTTISHELAHALYYSNPLLPDAMPHLFLRYAEKALDEAGVTDNQKDLTFLRKIIINPDLRTNELSKDDSKELDRLWNHYRLADYFPSEYSLSDEIEFFAELVGKQTPWHGLGVDPPYYDGWLRSIDAMSDGGAAAFLEEIEIQYPDPPTLHWKMERDPFYPFSKTGIALFCLSGILTLLGCAIRVHYRIFFVRGRPHLFPISALRWTGGIGMVAGLALMISTAILNR